MDTGEEGQTHLRVAASQVVPVAASFVVGEEGVCEPHGGLGESDALALELVGVGRWVIEDDALRLLALAFFRPPPRRYSTSRRRRSSNTNQTKAPVLASG